MNIIWPAFALVGSLGMMVGSGGSALVSKTFGEGDPDRANRIFSMLVRLTLIIGAVSAVVSFVRTLVLEMAAVFVLPLVFGIEGIWMSVDAAEILAFAMSMTLVFSFRKRYGY